MRRTALLLALAAAASGAWGQTVYRCGNTYSQEPCSPSAKPVDAPGLRPESARAPVTADRIQTNMELCRGALRASLKDPGSAQIEDERRLPSLMQGMNFSTGEKFQAITYTMRINARNGYGGYTGFKTAVCYFDPTEQTIKGYKVFD